MALRGTSVVLDGPNGAFSLEEHDVPEPSADGMLIRQELCGICGTDAHVYRGYLPGAPFPLVLGHETIGVVERLGANVTEDATGRPFAVGDRVSIAPGFSCGTCIFCTVHFEPSLCVNRRGYGFRPIKTAPPHFQGGFAQYLNVVGGSTVLKMDADVQTAVALEPLTIGINQVNRVHLKVGSTVIIQGAGAIGILTLAAVKEIGALKTIVIGAPQTRLDLAKAFGADVTINIEDVPDAAERIRLAREETLGGLGADAVFECAGVPAALPEGFEMLRRGGTFVEAGHYTDHGNAAINPFRHIVNKQATVIGVWGANTSHFVAGRALIESGKYPFRELISHTLPLDRLADGIAAMGTSYRLDGQEIRKIAVAANGF